MPRSVSRRGWRYDVIAGQSLERIAALSDGFFSIAMTLLVLDLHIPAIEAIHSEGDLRHALIMLAPRLIPYAMSFVTLGLFWVGQQTQLNYLERSNRDFAWIHFAFLLAVSLTPFSTALLAEFLTFRTALVVYWANIALLGTMLLMSWSYANRAGLVSASLAAPIRAAIYRRIVVAQTFYAAGALLCMINTYVSIAFIVCVQLYYAFGLRLPVGKVDETFAAD
jgi:uncharacterized membrane protein